MPLLMSVIRSLKRFSFFFSFLLALSFSFFSPVLQAATTQDLLVSIEGLEKKLDDIQKQQASLLDKTSELSEKLETVKVWAHRG